MQRHCFEAMGTSIELLVEADAGPGCAAAFRAAEREFHRLEAVFSRFRPDSELSALNRDGAIAASPELARVVRLALEARVGTGGRFDPTVHDAVVAAGYDRPFAQIEPDAASNAASPSRCGGAVVVDPASGRIQLEAGVRLDLGGIAKGEAVDRACGLLVDAGPCLVNAGGDLAVRGVPASGCWPVGLETGDGALTIGLESGAIATSGRDRRRWWSGGEERHHLIDPRTGRPAATDLLRVTAIAGTAVEAEVAAKSLFLAGERTATREADALGIGCVLVTESGRTILAGGLG